MQPGMQSLTGLSSSHGTTSAAGPSCLPAISSARRSCCAQVKRLEDTRKANEAAAAAAAAEEAAHKVEPQKAECTFDDFGKMDIRTATVLEAERVPKTDKLLKLTIDTGIDTRVIVSGIAEFYTPEQMVGKQICILANLAPRKIRGIESKGMILMARQGDGKMRFVTPEETLANGAEIG